MQGYGEQETHHRITRQNCHSGIWESRVTSLVRGDSMYQLETMDHINSIKVCNNANEHAACIRYRESWVKATEDRKEVVTQLSQTPEWQINLIMQSCRSNGSITV